METMIYSFLVVVVSLVLGKGAAYEYDRDIHDGYFSGRAYRTCLYYKQKVIKNRSCLR